MAAIADFVPSSIANDLGVGNPRVNFAEGQCEICAAAMEFNSEKADACCTQCGLTAKEADGLNNKKVKQPPLEQPAKGYGWVHVSEEHDGGVKYIDLPKMNASNSPPEPRVPTKAGGMPQKKAKTKKE